MSVTDVLVVDDGPIMCRVIHWIRSKRGAVPIILISCYDTIVVASRAEKLGISEFRQKPFSRETIKTERGQSSLTDPFILRSRNSAYLLHFSASLRPP
jgi:FixJ family two-component response regulator